MIDDKEYDKRDHIWGRKSNELDSEKSETDERCINISSHT